MTAAKLLDNALALLTTTRAQSPEYAEFAVPLINLLLAETHGCDNSLRASKGLAEREEAGEIASLDEELPCEPELARAALPFGLCARLVMDDDDFARAAYYYNQYTVAVEETGRWVPGAVADVYGGER